MNKLLAMKLAYDYDISLDRMICPIKSSMSWFKPDISYLYEEEVKRDLRGLKDVWRDI